MVARRQYATTIIEGADGRVLVPVPFDLEEVWGHKARHLIHGSVNGMGVRGQIETAGALQGFVLGPAWRRDCGLGPGDPVEVTIEPEGPQRSELADDVAAALAADPAAGEFFDSLAQFYRKAYLRWIDATKRRPEQRPVRIAEMVDLLRARVKERPR